MIKAAFKSRGDKDKFEESLEHDRAYQREADQMKLDFILGTSRVGPLKDIVEISIEMSKGESVTDKAAGVAAGDVVSKAAASALDGHIGSSAANAVGAVAGKLVGDAVEAGSAVRAASPSDDLKSSVGINLRDKR